MYIGKYGVIKPKEKRAKPNFSKLLCIICIVVFVLAIFSAVCCSIADISTEVFVYAIPATGVMAAAAVGFYFNKSKTENLSKQRIRYVLMKLLLKNQLKGEAYKEICTEIDNIDSVIDNKLNSSLQESVEEDIQVDN
jgi:hypothetical protein